MECGTAEVMGVVVVYLLGCEVGGGVGLPGVYGVLWKFLI